ncbi:hypothetical protein BD779DRAFT_1539884 [Infundibulicybe gibba]|nr:hypothetical protein BD779DRAFT_1539884 [Infundibulicybe gibba]
MDPPNLPTVRLQADSATVLDVPSSNKFSFSWASEPGKPVPAVPTPPQSERLAHSSSEGEGLSSEGESSHDHDADTPAAARSKSDHIHPAPSFPRLSRAFSMPHPAQLGLLQNPHRPPSKQSRSDPPSPEASQFHEISMDLADSVQMVIQTMLQISPSQVLDPAREQFSACSLAVPTPSMSAMFTAMKNLNYISANLATLCSDPMKIAGEPPPTTPPLIHNDFDVGEILQSVGDALSGAAAQLGVDLVLYHADVGIKHVSVRGDESGVSYVLLHVLRQVLNIAHRGDSIELGLLVASESTSGDESRRGSTSPVDMSSPLRVTFRISHKYSPSETRPDPAFSTLLLRRLLRQVGASLVQDLPLATCELSLTLERGSLSAANFMDAPTDDHASEEPTLDQLAAFSETLKGRRVMLYASAEGSFAHHLTSYLTAWGMNLTHVSPDGVVDGQTDSSSAAVPAPNISPSITPLLPGYGPDADIKTPTGSPPSIDTQGSDQHSLSFVFIDDDVNILRERMHALRTEHSYSLSINPRKRPPLSAHHRPRSSPNVARAKGQTTISAQLSPVVIMHFTSLSNYKITKDAVQSILSLYAGSTLPIPEIMIIPKPAGPRRFLTALHTAITKPVVDAFFAPTATSPVSPGSHNNSFFHSYTGNTGLSPGRTPKTHRPSGSRSNSDRSTKSTKDIPVEHVAHPAPPSPLGMSDNVEYFSEAAVKLGTSPSSGLVIQSPDGQPAGIFFHPRGKGQRNPSSHQMERDKGQPFITADRRRPSTSLAVEEKGGMVTFSSLHEAATAPVLPRVAAEALANASPPIGWAQGRKQASPRTEDTPSAGPSSVVIPRRNPSDIVRKAGTPPASPPNETPPTIPRRVVARRQTDAKDLPNPPAKKAKAAADGNIVPPINVLIVDDNPINRTILSTFMKKKKIKYDLATNGQEAVQKWRTDEFHLILMDIQMPIMDGIQATKEIRRLEKSNAAAGYPPATPSLEGQQTPPARTPSETSTDTRSTSSPYRSSVIIVALTASSLQSDRVAALAAGCNDFLTKPVNLLWLNSKIIEWGSIKALQMWADPRPEGSMTSRQAAQARSVAERLYVPKGRSSSPSQHHGLNGTVPVAELAAGIFPAPASGVLSGNTLASAVAAPSSPSSVLMPGQASPVVFWGSLGAPGSAHNTLQVQGVDAHTPTVPPPPDDVQEPPNQDIKPQDSADGSDAVQSAAASKQLEDVSAQGAGANEENASEHATGGEGGAAQEAVAGPDGAGAVSPPPP